MELRTLPLHPDRSDPLYAPAECQELLDTYAEYYPKHGFIPPWVGYVVVRESQIVGGCGFISAPVDNTVEVAYWTMKPFEGQGIASFACRQLIAIARTADPSVNIIAKTAPKHNASTRILQKNGFTYSGIVQDHEIGDAWLWTLA